jgi:hypothetical protein
VRDLSVAGWRIYVEFERWRVACRECGSVHVEQLDWFGKGRGPEGKGGLIRNA